MSDPSKNLKEAMNFITKQRVQSIDSALTQYIKSAILMLEVQGKNIEDYTLIQVHNPMEFVENGARVIVQWRIVHVDKVKNLPVVGETE